MKPRQRTKRPKHMRKEEEIAHFAVQAAERVMPLIKAGAEEVTMSANEVTYMIAAIKALYVEAEKFAQISATTANEMIAHANKHSRAIEVMMEWGDTSDLHKGWVLDQVARALAGYRDGENDDTYRAFLAEYERRTGEEWDMGIEP